MGGGRFGPPESVTEVEAAWGRGELCAGALKVAETASLTSCFPHGDNNSNTLS